MKPLYIFDLDGTLANIAHRRHLVADKKNQRWDEFYRACVDDKPNKAIMHIFINLFHTNGFFCNNDIYVFSGRSDIVKQETLQWLEFHTGICEIELFHNFKLKMRPDSDNTPDEVLKREWYEELPKEDKYRLVCVYDDRQKVVDMWRSIGVTCLQVAPGDF